MVPQVGPVTAKNLVSYCGSAEAVFRAPRKELLRIPGIGPSLVQMFQDGSVLQRAEYELNYMERHDISAVFYTDDQYPTRLRQNTDCPALLFFKGSDLGLLNANRILGVVGTRQPSEHGRLLCENLIEQLQPHQVLVVSGLAYGIDIAAHRKACNLGIPNIGVLGHGLSTIYPADHRPIALKMLESGGLLTEYPQSTKPDREHFPMRNRIVAGISDALLVVETAASGGSMISAELALQYGREVLAVPGRPQDAKSSGCNLLIKNNRARLVESAADIAQVMNWVSTDKPAVVQTALFHDFSPSESTLVEYIREKPEIPIDELTLASGMHPGELASTLLTLEFKGIIRTLPGKRYRLSSH